MQLKNNRLCVTFAEENEIDTQRFDRSAIVTQVVLDGKYSYCVPEQLLAHRPTTNGVGLCGELVIYGPAEAARAGDWFVKPGVGLLKQLEDNIPYSMWKTYEGQYLTAEYALSENALHIRQANCAAGEYGAQVEKCFTLEENRLILDTKVTNTGSVPYELQEYQHNFVWLDGRRAGPGYELAMPCHGNLPGFLTGRVRTQGTGEPADGVVSVAGDTLRWEKDLEERVLYLRCDDVKPAAPRYWELRFPGVPAMREETGFLPTRLDVWAVEHCISTEYYTANTIAPGESAVWRRVWVFGE